MNKYTKLLLPLAFLAFTGAAGADDWKDESGKGKRHERREFREEYWDGNCKVERKMETDGEYKEERKCKPARHASRRDYRVVVPVHEERVYYPEPVYESAKPSISVDLNIRR
jgi:hypothetical protein